LTGLKADVQKPGAILMSKSPDGRGIPQLSVHEAKDKTIVVDLNHLLADKRLNFDVKVTDIKAAEAR
jgi:FKBP-type peptidyl-prolyl cis-trans isomerase 2